MKWMLESGRTQHMPNSKAYLSTLITKIGTEKVGNVAVIGSKRYETIQIASIVELNKFKFVQNSVSYAPDIMLKLIFFLKSEKNKFQTRIVDDEKEPKNSIIEFFFKSSYRVQSMGSNCKDSLYIAMGTLWWTETTH